MKKYDLLLNELRKLGLSTSEASVYMAVLELRQSNAKEISQKTGLSRPTTYRVIHHLQKKRTFK